MATVTGNLVAEAQAAALRIESLEGQLSEARHECDRLKQIERESNAAMRNMLEKLNLRALPAQPPGTVTPTCPTCRKLADHVLVSNPREFRCPSGHIWTVEAHDKLATASELPARPQIVMKAHPLTEMFNGRNRSLSEMISIATDMAAENTRLAAQVEELKKEVKILDAAGKRMAADDRARALGIDPRWDAATQSMLRVGSEDTMFSCAKGHGWEQAAAPSPSAAESEQDWEKRFDERFFMFAGDLCVRLERDRDIASPATEGDVKAFIREVVLKPVAPPQPAAAGEQSVNSADAFELGWQFAATVLVCLDARDIGRAFSAYYWPPGFGEIANRLDWTGTKAKAISDAKRMVREKLLGLPPLPPQPVAAGTTDAFKAAADIEAESLVHAGTAAEDQCIDFSLGAAPSQSAAAVEGTDRRMLQFVEPHPTGGDSLVTISAAKAIAWQRKAGEVREYQYENDEQALADFIACHWAEFIPAPSPAPSAESGEKWGAFELEGSLDSRWCLGINGGATREQAEAAAAKVNAKQQVVTLTCEKDSAAGMLLEKDRECVELRAKLSAAEAQLSSLQASSQSGDWEKDFDRLFVHGDDFWLTKMHPPTKEMPQGWRGVSLPSEIKSFIREVVLKPVTPPQPAAAGGTVTLSAEATNSLIKHGAICRNCGNSGIGLDGKRCVCQKPAPPSQSAAAVEGSTSFEQDMQDHFGPNWRQLRDAEAQRKAESPSPAPSAESGEKELLARIDRLEDRLRCLRGNLANEEPRQVEEWAQRIADGEPALAVITEAVSEYKAHFNYSCEMREAEIREHKAQLSSLHSEHEAAEKAWQFVNSVGGVSVWYETGDTNTSPRRWAAKALGSNSHGYGTSPLAAVLALSSQLESDGVK